MGYFYENFDKNNFVVISVFIYPIPADYIGKEAIDKELEMRYPNSETDFYVLSQGEYTAEGKYLTESDERFFVYVLGTFVSS